MNPFVGKIHLTQDKLMSVEMWYVDATPWCNAIGYADLFVSLAEEVSADFADYVRYYNYFFSHLHVTHKMTHELFCLQISTDVRSGCGSH
jgi:hypothetical protein